MNESRSFPDDFRLGSGTVSPFVDKRDTHYLAHREDFRLGRADIRPSVRTVHGSGGSATAEPRVMQVLLALADAKGGVVTRDDLIHQCWKGQIVGDDAVNRAIKEVRRIARETGAGFAIETIPRIGFRLVEDAIDAPGQQTAEAELVSASTPSSGKLMRRAVLTGALAASAGGLVFWNSSSKLTDAAERLIQESQIVIRSGTPSSDRAAIALLEQAVAASPDNARAWGLLALTRARADEHAVDETVSSITEIERAAGRALALDANNGDARAARAIAIPYYGDWIAAERRYDEVLARHRNHVVTRDSRLFFLGAVGRIRESARERLALADAAPFDANLHFRYIYALWFLGRIPEADRAAARGLEMWPRHPGIWFARLWVLTGTGRFDRALAQVADEAGRPPLPPPMFDTLQAAVSAAQSKDPGQVSAAANRVMLGVSGSVAAVVNAIMLFNLMGAVDEAFALADAYYLEKGPILAAVQWRPGQPVVPDQRRRKTNMLFTPTAAPMQRDPRFMPLMQQMGLAEYWDRRGVVPDFLSAPIV